MAKVEARRNGIASHKRHLGVWDLLCWAFQREHARVDFSEQATGQADGPQRWDTIAKMIEINRLGCRVDGGGRSEPHHDADIVAGTLAVLPESLGGQRSALWVAELARAGLVPEYDAEMRVVPVRFNENQHGRRPAVIPSYELGVEGWPKTYRTNRKGRQVLELIQCTPVEVRPSARDIARMRRSYSHWMLILLELKTHLQISHLTSHVVTDQLPPRQPWLKKA